MNEQEQQEPGLVGLCGLGNMGSAIASRLAAAGPVVAYDPDEKRPAAAAESYGAPRARNLPEVAAAGTLVLSLPTPEISQATVDTLVRHMRRGG